ncbi:hypothetical protein GCM10023317_60450 [Actinopolymorpha pittospori]
MATTRDTDQADEVGRGLRRPRPTSHIAGPVRTLCRRHAWAAHSGCARIPKPGRGYLRPGLASLCLA